MKNAFLYCICKHFTRWTLAIPKSHYKPNIPEMLMSIYLFIIIKLIAHAFWLQGMYHDTILQQCSATRQYENRIIFVPLSVLTLLVKSTDRQSDILAMPIISEMLPSLVIISAKDSPRSSTPTRIEDCTQEPCAKRWPSPIPSLPPFSPPLPPLYPPIPFLYPSLPPFSPSPYCTPFTNQLSQN